MCAYPTEWDGKALRLRLGHSCSQRRQLQDFQLLHRLLWRQVHRKSSKKIHNMTFQIRTEIHMYHVWCLLKRKKLLLLCSPKGRETGNAVAEQVLVLTSKQGLRHNLSHIGHFLLHSAHFIFLCSKSAAIGDNRTWEAVFCPVFHNLLSKKASFPRCVQTRSAKAWSFKSVVSTANSGIPYPVNIWGSLFSAG